MSPNPGPPSARSGDEIGPAAIRIASVIWLRGNHRPQLARVGLDRDDGGMRRANMPEARAILSVGKERHRIRAKKRESPRPAQFVPELLELDRRLPVAARPEGRD